MICGPATITKAIGNTLAKSMRQTLSQSQVAFVSTAYRTEQRQRICFDSRRNPLDALQRQVSLSTLDAAHVGAMDTEHLGESLLTQPASLAVGAKVVADVSLQVALHDEERSRSAT